MGPKLPTNGAALSSAPGGWGAGGRAGEVVGEEAQHGASDMAPDGLGHLHAAGELAPLVVLGQLVAVGGRGEAALVAERALLERDVARGLVDTAADLVGGLDLGALRAHQAEHNRLALRHKAERGEVARALVVVLEEEAVDTHVAEQDLGHGLVAALGAPGALEIAAAEVGAGPHVGRGVADRVVDEPAVETGEVVRVVAAGARRLADRGI